MGIKDFDLAFTDTLLVTVVLSPHSDGFYVYVMIWAITAKV